MLGEERWRERCERYFSSITDIRQEADGSGGAADTGKSKKDANDKKKKKKGKGGHNDAQTNLPNVLNNHTATAAAERTTRKTTKKTTMKKTTKDRVIIRANGTAYRTKHRPLKGPRRWLSSLDLHGTSMLTRTESIAYFFFWILITLAGCAAFGYFVYFLVHDFLKDSSHFKVSVSTSGDLPLAVSVCNLNPVRKSHIANSRFSALLNLNMSAPSTNYQQVRPADLQLLLQRTELERFLAREQYSRGQLMAVLEEVQKEYPVYGSMLSEEDWDSLYASSLQAGHFDSFARALRMTPMEMSSLGHYMQASMLQCLKNGHDCDVKGLSYPRVLDYGNCATVDLSSDSASWFDTLSLIYDVEPEEYVDFVTSSRGMRVFLHTPQEGFWRSDEFVAPVGSVLKLHVVKSKEIERLSSNCRQAVDYDHSHCMQSCMESETRSVCGCSRSVSATLNQKCRPNVQYEYLCYRLIETLAKRDQLHCDCPSNCREYKYDIQTIQVPWPTQIYENHVRKSLLANGFIKSFPSVRDALTKIEISLGHTERVLMKEEKDVTWQQLLMQIGALSALTVGVSMVTGVELVWLICRLLFQCAKAAWRGRHEDKQVQAMTTASYPEFDDLGFNWYTLQSPEAEQQKGGGGHSSGPMLTTETELTPPLAPNLLALDPILEESDVDIRAVEGMEENNLYAHAWERSGQSRPYTRVLVSGKEANISDAPLLNAPANHASLRSEIYRPSADSQPAAASPYASQPQAEKGLTRGAGNYVLKSRAPYTWHSANPSGPTSRQGVMTPADFISVYGQTARQLYEEDDGPGFYLA